MGASFPAEQAVLLQVQILQWPSPHNCRGVYRRYQRYPSDLEGGDIRRIGSMRQGQMGGWEMKQAKRGQARLGCASLEPVPVLPSHKLGWLAKRKPAIPLWDRRLYYAVLIEAIRFASIKLQPVGLLLPVLRRSSLPPSAAANATCWQSPFPPRRRAS